jgi:hypothetical protein
MEPTNVTNGDLVGRVPGELAAALRVFERFVTMYLA